MAEVFDLLWQNIDSGSRIGYPGAHFGSEMGMGSTKRLSTKYCYPTLAES